MRDTTFDLWRERMGRAARLISPDGDAEPSLDALAAAAGVSPFHFHRMWRALTGETVAETTRRVRLTAAASTLTMTAEPVTAIGLDAGFATPQSFARAFRRETGLSPTAFREGASAALPTAPDHAPIEIVWLDPVTVIAKRREGRPYEALNEEFQAVWDWAQSAGQSGDLRGFYGVPYDDPASVPIAALRYDACIDLGPQAAPPPQLRALTLGEGDYARLRLTGGYDGLDAATLTLWTWLLHSGREPAEAPVFHHFHNDPETTPEADLVTDILLKLQSQGA